MESSVEDPKVTGSPIHTIAYAMLPCVHKYVHSIHILVECLSGALSCVVAARNDESLNIRIVRIGT
jgi:hypothetical protein